MVYRITREYWDDSGDYQAYWTEDSSEQIFTADSLERVQAYVDQKNQEFIDETTEAAQVKLKSARDTLDRIARKAAAMALLTADDLDHLGVKPMDVKASLDNASQQIEKYEKELHRIREAPYVRVDRWRVPVTTRYVFELIELRELTLAGDNPAPTDVDG
jgi:hypothetical protein